MSTGIQAEFDDAVLAQFNETQDGYLSVDIEVIRKIADQSKLLVLQNWINEGKDMTGLDVTRSIEDYLIESEPEAPNASPTGAVE